MKTRAVLEPGEKIWSLPELAERLDVHCETLRRAVRAGRLRGIILPGSAGTRFADSAVQNYLRSMERGHT